MKIVLHTRGIQGSCGTDRREDAVAMLHVVPEINGDKDKKHISANPKHHHSKTPQNQGDLEQ